MSTHVYNNLIGGAWVPARTGKTFLNTNPADGDDLIGEFQESGAEDVAAAVDAAAEAYRTWRLVPAPKRAEILYRCGEILASRKEDYAQAMTREMGKVLKDPRRCAGGHRHGLLHGRRRPPPLWADHSV